MYTRASKWTNKIKEMSGPWKNTKHKAQLCTYTQADQENYISYVSNSMCSHTAQGPCSSDYEGRIPEGIFSRQREFTSPKPLRRIPPAQGHQLRSQGPKSSGPKLTQMNALKITSLVWTSSAPRFQANALILPPNFDFWKAYQADRLWDRVSTHWTVSPHNPSCRGGDTAAPPQAGGTPDTYRPKHG